jgi:uncharacterized protein (TIGR02996 family)
MDDGQALLRAILREPAEDTPRVLYADYLDENGQPARAEVIRVQIELAPHRTRPRGGRSNIPSHRCVECNTLWTRWENDGTWSLACADAEPCCDNVAMGEQIVPLDAATVELFCRESNLLARNWQTWFREAVPGRMSNQGPIPYFVLTDRRFVNIEVTRGFISGVTLSADTFIGDGVRCDACLEGMTDCETGVVECRRCDSTGILCEPIAGDLFAKHPITTVVFEDREPGQFVNTKQWYWGEETSATTYARNSLPSELFRRLRVLPSYTPNRTHIYQTRREAIGAASAVAVRHGRELAGLPELTPSAAPSESS